MFSCPPITYEETKYKCLFQGIGGQCYDQVSKFICNGHAEYFGLKYMVQNYMTATNESFTKIITCTTTTPFNVPFFIDLNNVVDLKEIETFAHNVAHSFRGVRTDVLAERINCWYANQYPPICNTFWMDSINVAVQTGDEIKFMPNIPVLIKLLLHYVEVSNTFDDTGKQILYVPNLTVVLNKSNNKLCLKLLNPSMVLKYHEKENPVVTPLVLHSYKKITAQQEVIQYFKPIMRTQC